MKHKLLALCLVLVLTLTFALPLSADVGNVDWGGGGGGGGGYDWGGGYDDYDYSGGGGSIITIEGDSTTGGIVCAVVLVFVVLYFVAKRKASGGGATVAAQMTVRQSGDNPITAEQEAAVVAQVRAADPDFSAEQMRTYAADVILRVQEAWEARDWGVVRPYESDALFAVHQRQLQELIDQKKTNHMDNQYIQRTTLAAFAADGKLERLTVRIDMSLSDYTTDDATGQVVSGSQHAKFIRAYRLEFIRTAGTKTDTSTDVKAHSCPSCGAPLDLNASGRCSYCDCVVTSGEYGWVLNSYNKW